MVLREANPIPERRQKEWLALYAIAESIAAMQPWMDFAPTDPFVFIRGAGQMPLYFSFVVSPTGQRGIACYRDTNAYVRGRQRLAQKNEKDEPLFYLQDAWVAIWDDRELLSPASYAQIRGLGLKPRGRGAWLHFDRYAVGYIPVPLETREIEPMTEGLQNLYMMLRAVCEQGLTPHFDRSEALIRLYDPQQKLYHTMSAAIPLSTDILPQLQVTLRENAVTRRIRQMPAQRFSLEIDWAYAQAAFVDDAGRKSYPRLLVATAPGSGCATAHRWLSPTHDHPRHAVALMADWIEQNGKPAAVSVRDRELQEILTDACRKLGVRLVSKKRLPAVDAVRRDLLQELL